MTSKDRPVCYKVAANRLAANTHAPASTSTTTPCSFGVSTLPHEYASPSTSAAELLFQISASAYYGVSDLSWLHLMTCWKGSSVGKTCPATQGRLVIDSSCENVPCLSHGNAVHPTGNNLPYLRACKVLQESSVNNPVALLCCVVLRTHNLPVCLKVQEASAWGV